MEKQGASLFHLEGAEESSAVALADFSLLELGESGWEFAVKLAAELEGMMASEPGLAFPLFNGPGNVCQPAENIRKAAGVQERFS